MDVRVKLSLVPQWDFPAIYPVVPIKSLEPSSGLKGDRIDSYSTLRRIIIDGLGEDDWTRRVLLVLGGPVSIPL